MSADVQAELDRVRLELAATRALLHGAREQLVQLGCQDRVLLHRLAQLFPRRPCLRSPRRPRQPEGAA